MIWSWAESGTFNPVMISARLTPTENMGGSGPSEILTVGRGLNMNGVDTGARYICIVISTIVVGNDKATVFWK